MPNARVFRYLDDRDPVITDPGLMSAGAEVWSFCEENSESVELWSPGDPFFQAPQHLPAPPTLPVA